MTTSEHDPRRTTPRAGPVFRERPPGGGSPVPGGAQAQHRPASDAEAAVETARQSAEELAGSAKDKAAELGQEARGMADEAKQQMRAAAEQQKEQGATRLSGFAGALRTASDDLGRQGQDFAATYMQQAADGLERVSDAMRHQDLDQLVAHVEDFARRQPIAFLGGAVLAGFGLARVMKSSAERRRTRPAESAPPYGPNYGEPS